MVWLYQSQFLARLVIVTLKRTPVVFCGSLTLLLVSYALTVQLELVRRLFRLLHG